MEFWLIGLGVLAVVAILLWMAWKAGQASIPEPQPFTGEVARNGIPVIDRAKVDANIRRFTLAIQQNEKGKERDTELRRQLDYWKTLDIALRSKGE